MRDYGLSLRPDNCRTNIHYTRHPMPYTPSNPHLEWCCAPAFYNLCDISPRTQISTDGDPQTQGDEVRWPTVRNPQQRAAAKRGRARRFDLEDLPPVSMGGVPIRQPGDPEQDQEQVLIAGPLYMYTVLSSEPGRVCTGPTPRSHALNAIGGLLALQSGKRLAYVQCSIPALFMRACN